MYTAMLAYRFNKLLPTLTNAFGAIYVIELYPANLDVNVRNHCQKNMHMQCVVDVRIGDNSAMALTAQPQHA